jgi:hypothetical protein
MENNDDKFEKMKRVLMTSFKEQSNRCPFRVCKRDKLTCPNWDNFTKTCPYTPMPPNKELP